jgi:hypothetical protein
MASVSAVVGGRSTTVSTGSTSCSGCSAACSASSVTHAAANTSAPAAAVLRKFSPKPRITIELLPQFSSLALLHVILLRTARFVP